MQSLQRSLKSLIVEERGQPRSACTARRRDQQSTKALNAYDLPRHSYIQHQARLAWAGMVIGRACCGVLSQLRAFGAWGAGRVSLPCTGKSRGR